MIYVVQPGDTLSAISQRFGVGQQQILWLNQIPNRDALVVGQAILLLNSIKTGALTRQVGGYAYPFISPWVLTQTLPFLNLFSSFSYGFLPDGTLLPPVLNDTWMLRRADTAGVTTALVLTPLGPDGQFSNVLISALLRNVPAQERLLEQMTAMIAEKGFGEVNIDFEYILGEDRDAFTDFVRRTVETVPVPVSVCLAPKNDPAQRGVLFDGKDYPALGALADRVLFMAYEWGYKYGAPLAIAPLDQVRRVIEYAVSVIDPAKFDLGLANYGYDWPLPFVRGETVARTIGSVEAVETARRVGAEIQFDETAQSPYFTYTENGISHIVWFEDVRSWQSKIDLVEEFGLSGVGIWTVMPLFRAGLNLLGDNWRDPSQN